jgi:plasmid stabilization system protein ParE
MRVRYSPRARGDLEAIVNYLAQHNLEAAKRVRQAVANTIRVIGEFPESGRLTAEPGVRVLPVGRFPYLIYWSVAAGEAVIVHIRDGRRKPWR